MEKEITFRELRNFLSFYARLSINILESESYENFICIKDVPVSYDDYYVYGIGMTESEFFKVGEWKYEYSASGNRENLTLAFCIEIVLSKKPKFTSDKQ